MKLNISSMVVMMSGLALLAGCEAGPTPAEKSTSALESTQGQRMTRDQLVSAYTGNSVYEKTDTYELTVFYQPDGMSQGRAFWDGGEEISAGKWRITDDGQYCSKWVRADWGNNSESCFALFWDNDHANWVRVSGEMQRRITGQSKFHEGNKFNM